jgi:hypothetical protein
MDPIHDDVAVQSTSWRSPLLRRAFDRPAITTTATRAASDLLEAR